MKTDFFDIPLFEKHLREKKNLAEGSVITYSQVVQKFLSSNPDIEKLEEYNNFLIEGSIRKRNGHYYSALKNFIEWKIVDASIKNRLIDGMIKPPIRQDIKVERKYLDEDTVISVINNMKEYKHRVISLIQELTGVRAGDILNLSEGNIIPEEYQSRPVLRLNILGKRKKRNVVYIHDDTAQAIIMDYITRFPGFNGYYFIQLGRMKNRPGNTSNQYRLNRMNYYWYWDDLKQALNAVGVNKEDFATHDFRRCFARRVWEKYKDLQVLQDMLNHSDPKTTMRYLKQSGLKTIDYHFAMQTNK